MWDSKQTAQPAITKEPPLPLPPPNNIFASTHQKGYTCKLLSAQENKWGMPAFSTNTVKLFFSI